MAHLTVAASQATFEKIFKAVRDKYVFERSASTNFGRFTAGYHIKFHLEGGTVDFRADNTVLVKEMDIKWDILDLSLTFDIPEACVGGFCVIPNPFDGCWLEAPKVCFFSPNPDVDVTIPLGGITSEATVAGTLRTRYWVNPDRPPATNDWDAQEAIPKLCNEWRLYLDPQWVDIDIIDVADTVGDLLERLVEEMIDSMLGPLPDFLKDIIRGLLSPVIDILREVLDFGDDIQEWVSDLLNTSLGLVNIVSECVLAVLTTRLVGIEDPYPMLAAANNPNGEPAKLIPVKVPIRGLTVYNDDVEMVLEASVG